MFWKTKREKELEEQLCSLKKKAEELMGEKYHLLAEVAKFARWKQNPLSYFQDQFFGLTQDELNIGNPARPIEFDIGSLSKEDQVNHLAELSQINKSMAFQRETDAMIKDISRDIVLLDESGRETKRQLILFIIGLRMRIGSLATKFDSTHQPKQENDISRT